MDEKQRKALIRLAKKQLKQKITKEQSLERLQNASILDENGDFTEPYKNLGKIWKWKHKE